MTSLFARNERLLWRTRFSTTEMPSQFLTQYNTIKSWQFSLFSLKLSLQSTHVHAPIETALAQSARPPCNLQTARCSLQTARGFQIAWNIYKRTKGRHTSHVFRSLVIFIQIMSTGSLQFAPDHSFVNSLSEPETFQQSSAHIFPKYLCTREVLVLTLTLVIKASILVVHYLY